MASCNIPKVGKLHVDKIFCLNKDSINVEYTPSIVTRKCFGDQLLKMRCMVVSEIIFGKTFDGQDEKSGN